MYTCIILHYCIIIENLHLLWWAFCGILFSTIRLLFALFTLDQCPCPCPWQWHSQPPHLSSCKQFMPRVWGISTSQHSPFHRLLLGATPQGNFQHVAVPVRKSSKIFKKLFSSLPSVLPKWSHCFASPTTYGLSPNLIESRKPTRAQRYHCTFITFEHAQPKRS